MAAILALFLAGAVWAEIPTSNVIYRVLRIRTAAGTGSAFTIEVDGKQYLVTARHNLKGFGGEGSIDLWTEGRWSPARRAPSIRRTRPWTSRRSISAGPSPSPSLSSPPPPA